MVNGPIETLSDEQLVERIRGGDSAGAGELARRYWPAIVRFATSQLSDATLAEDVAQETFAKLSDIDTLPTGAVRPWLYKVARNRCLDIHRHHQRSPTHNHPIRTGFDAPRQSAGPRTRAARQERQEMIREIIEQMPEEYRSVLLLKFFEKLSRTEMAEVLEVSEQTVKGRLFRASEYLHDELRKLTGTNA